MHIFTTFNFLFNNVGPKQSLQHFKVKQLETLQIHCNDKMLS